MTTTTNNYTLHPSYLGRPLVIAIYARYSCDQQRETSIDDQLRRCREVAIRKGFSVDKILIFSDDALSGQSKHNDKRIEYQNLLQAWDAGQFDVLITDEFSRLTRDGVDSALIIRRLEASRRVQLMTADGIDTAVAGWQLLIGMTSIINQHEVRSTSHRVPRGMLGQLERGHMIAAAPYGYALQRIFNGQGERTATNWVIDEQEAVIVRDIFDRRVRGQSMHQIARHLNEHGVAPRRPPKKSTVGYWRPAAIRNLLSNTIYKGIFTWHGSSTIRYQARKTGDEVKTQTFSRPALRLVSDETWSRCNSPSISRTGYGGGKHALAGLVTCGCCGATLVLSSVSRCRSLYCASCTATKSATRDETRQTITVAAAGVQQMLTTALAYFLTPEFVEAFRGSLRAKLLGNAEEDIDNCRKQLAKLQRSQDTLSRLIANADEEDPLLITRYEESRQKTRDLRAELDRLTAGQVTVDESAIAAQLAIDPRALLPRLFDATLPPEQVRATLAQLFPRIVLEGKSAKYCSHWCVQFSPGAAMAVASGTATVSDEVSEMRFALKYRTDNRSRHLENRWSVVATPGIGHPSAPSPMDSRGMEFDTAGR